MTIAFISNILPGNTTATSLIFYRHFGRLKEGRFVFFTSTQQSAGLPGEVRKIEYPAWVKRISSTRFHEEVETIVDWVGWPPGIIKQTADEVVRRGVNLIVTLAQGRESQLALAVARKTKIPLWTFFHDWWPDMGNHGKLKRLGMRRFFLDLARNSRVCACVSPRMLEQLKPHAKQAHLLWPIPGFWPTPIQASPSREMTVLHAGSLYAPYEPLILSLIKSLRQEPRIRLWVTGKPQEWSEKGTKEFYASGAALGFLDRSELQKRLEDADALLSITPFSEALKSWTASYFPSKVVEYCQLAKPIVVWAPLETAISDWCRRTGAAVLVSEEDSLLVVKRMSDLLDQPGLRQQLGTMALAEARGAFSPERLQQQFEGLLSEAISPN